MPRPSPRSSTVPDRDTARSAATALALDVLVVAVFVVIGRRSHAEGLMPAGWWETAWPFLGGLVLGWVSVVAGLGRAPGTLLTGLPVWIATVFGGMALRDMSGQGTALPFVVVATLSLALGLLGWRAVAMLLERRRRGPAAVPTPHRGRVVADPTPDPLRQRELGEQDITTPGRGVLPPQERSRYGRRPESQDDDEDR